jgi:SAM-dependent methyltransferase
MADYKSFDGHGVDVAVNRADDVDKKILTYIAEHPGCRVLDLGSGAGGQSVRMAKAGAQVTAVDQFDFTDQFEAYKNDQLQFVNGDVQQLAILLPDQEFTAALCQRTVHYLPYEQAKEFLGAVQAHTTDKLFISVTGTGSLIGEVYPAAALPIEDRFAELSDLGKDMFSIREPVCLYNQEEFANLLQSAGWIVDECWVSAFGNIKAVCSKG